MLRLDLAFSISIFTMGAANGAYTVYSKERSLSEYVFLSLNKIRRFEISYS
jgi:hypothetical protein